MLSANKRQRASLITRNAQSINRGTHFQYKQQIINRANINYLIGSRCYLFKLAITVLLIQTNNSTTIDGKMSQKHQPYINMQIRGRNWACGSVREYTKQSASPLLTFQVNVFHGATNKSAQSDTAPMFRRVRDCITRDLGQHWPGKYCCPAFALFIVVAAAAMVAIMYLLGCTLFFFFSCTCLPLNCCRESRYYVLVLLLMLSLNWIRSTFIITFESTENIRLLCYYSRTFTPRAYPSWFV